MSTSGCIGVADFHTADDNFDNKDWLAFTDVSYKLLSYQTTYDVSDTTIIMIYNRPDDKHQKPTLEYTGTRGRKRQFNRT